MTKNTMTPTVAAQSSKNAQTDWWSKSATAPKQQNKILQTINFNLGTFDDEARSFMAIASSPCVDRQGDVVEQAGWDLTNFKNNPVIPWAHDYSQPPVARAVEIGVQDGVLQMKVQFPPEGLYPFADTIWNLYRNQFLFAFSVGFIPEEPAEGWNWEGNTFAKSELLEVSAVVVPANPQALALAAKQGVIDTAQTKLLITRLEDASSNLKDVLKTQAVDKAANDATKGAADALDAAELVRTVLIEAGLIKETSEEQLTEANNNKENGIMKKTKTEISNEAETKGKSNNLLLAPAAKSRVKEAMKSIGETADLLNGHIKALREHSDTMNSHADAIQTKSDMLKGHAEALKDLLNHNGDETSNDQQADDHDGDDGENGDEKPSKSVKTAITKDAVVEEAAAPVEETPVEEIPAAEGTEEVTPTEGEKAEVDGEVKSEEEAAAPEVAAEAEKAEVVAEEAVDAPTDGADHEEEKVEEVKTEEAAAEAPVEKVEDKTYDPSNLTDDDVQEILASLNKRVK